MVLQQHAEGGGHKIVWVFIFYVLFAEPFRATTLSPGVTVATIQAEGATTSASSINCEISKDEFVFSIFYPDTCFSLFMILPKLTTTSVVCQSVPI